MFKQNTLHAAVPQAPQWIRYNMEKKSAESVVITLSYLLTNHEN
jgi:hypothetical protein